MFAKSTRSMCKRLEGGLRFVQGVIDDLFSYQMMHVVVENVCDSHVDAITRGMEGVMIRKVDQRVQESISRCMADVVSKMAPPQRMPKSCLLPKSMVRQYVSLHYLPLLNSLMHWMYLRFLNRHLDSMQREERWYIDSWWDSIQAENVQYVQYITVPRIRRNAQNGVLQYDSECESEFSEDNDDADEDAGESDEEMDEFYVGRDGSDVDSGGSDDSGHREVSHNSLSPCWFCTCIGRNVEYFWRQLEYKFVPQGFETPKSIEKYGMPHERRFNISTFAGAGGIYIIDLEDATGIMDVSYQLARIVHESGGVVESSFIRDENNLYLCVARVVEWFRGRKCVFIVAGLGICRCNNEWVSELRNLTKCGRGSVMFLTTSRPAK